MSEKKKRIGIMGGTFDPIHIGHLILGETAYHQFQLDKILFMPAGNPPHKQARENRATDRQRVTWSVWRSLPILIFPCLWKKCTERDTLIPIGPWSG